ncbi:hypothetical protein [Azospirillum halopraeferens]|uniref:hypothetical protein n=1 Tax=Azospirillum halopraeferens TaxID=34010 RepID=UPI00042348AC|nr:hypothetical protein [Azospirillum halopraeferens]
MLNPLITLTAGWSPAVEERATRLLAFRLGTTADGTPVTVAAAFAGRGRPAPHTARLLMHLPPLEAVQVLTHTLADFTIDGASCPDPAATARAALAHAGRAVTIADAHPERAFIARLLSFLFELRRPTR